MLKLHRARAKLKNQLLDYMTSRRLIYQNNEYDSEDLETAGAKLND